MLPVSESESESESEIDSESGSTQVDVTDNLTPIRVAVKFFQPSLLSSAFMAIPDPNPDREARSEAAVYDVLHELQGTCIPYFFGKQPVSTHGPRATDSTC